jgi:hypothetical protein
MLGASPRRAPQVPGSTASRRYCSMRPHTRSHGHGAIIHQYTSTVGALLIATGCLRHYAGRARRGNV